MMIYKPDCIFRANDFNHLLFVPNGYNVLEGRYKIVKNSKLYDYSEPSITLIEGSATTHWLNCSSVCPLVAPVSRLNKEGG